MIQMKLFNFSWYDKKRMIYHIETTKSHYKVYENPDGTIKKTVGLGHGTIARNSFETNNAKSLVQMLATRLEEKYVKTNNLLPVLYNPSNGCNRPISINIVYKKKEVQNWSKLIENLKKRNFTLKFSSDNETLFAKYKNF